MGTHRELAAKRKRGITSADHLQGTLRYPHLNPPQLGASTWRASWRMSVNLFKQRFQALLHQHR